MSAAPRLAFHWQSVAVYIAMESSGGELEYLITGHRLKLYS
jgi:hypothetical protein